MTDGPRRGTSRLSTCLVLLVAAMPAGEVAAETGAHELRLEVLEAPAEAVLAIAAGNLDGVRGDELALLTETAVLVRSATGTARFPLPPRGSDSRPTRDPVGGIAVHAGEVIWSLPSIGGGGRLVLRAGELAASGELPADRVPLASGAAGLLTGVATPGRNTFGPSLRLLAGVTDLAPRAGSAGGSVLAAAAARRGTSPPLGVVTSAGTFVPLGPDLAPAGATIEGVGAGLALADLDGDGTVELVASSSGAAPPDSVRVLSIHGGARRFQTGELPARLVAGAAADLDGDGLDEAILGGAGPGGGYLVRILATGPR